MSDYAKMLNRVLRWYGAIHEGGYLQFFADTEAFEQAVREGAERKAKDAEAQAEFERDAKNLYAERATNAEERATQLERALRRYMTYTETFGYERLAEEVGPCEHPESSLSMEAWLDRVLREPARAAIESRQTVPQQEGADGRS